MEGRQQGVGGSEHNPRPSLETVLHLPPCHMRMLLARLSGDMASALRQASKAERDAVSDDAMLVCDPTLGPSCTSCSTQIMAAFQVGPI